MADSDWVDDPHSNDWVDEPHPGNQPQTSPVVSAIRQLAQGASGGFSDELAGLIEGAGRAAGVNGLGGPMKNISVAPEGPTTDWDVLKDAYKRARDKERASLAKDSKDNPVTSTIANLAGAVASPLSKLGPAAAGATMAAGASDADLTNGDFGGLARDTAIGLGTGAAVGKIVPAATGAIQNTLEDVATAPLTQPGAQMGPVAKGLGAIGKAGDAFDNVTSSVTKGLAGTGNDAADGVLNQVAKKSAYMLPGVGKLVAGADLASAVPNMAQKVSQLALKGGDKVSDLLMKSPVLSELMSRNPQAFNAIAQKVSANISSSKDDSQAQLQKFEPDSIVQKAQGTKYASVLQNAAQRGPEAVRAANFVLQGRDPAYRKLTIGDEDRTKDDSTDDQSWNP